MIDFFAEEWGNSPFISIDVSMGFCYEYATERVWHGTQEYEWWKRRMLRGRGSSSSKKNKQDATPPRKSMRFKDGTAICVERSMAPLVNIEEGDCPTG